MRRRIAWSLLAVFLCSAAGVAVAVSLMSSSTATLRHLIDLHQVEELRKHLIIAVQTAQADLFTVRTDLGKSVDVIAENVAQLERAAKACSTCHHAPAAAARIDRVAALISAYQEQLSYYITASANQERVARLKQEAATTGADLLRMTEEMSFDAGHRLQLVTATTLTRIDRARVVLFAATLAAFLLALAVAVRLTSSITGPIDQLVRATRAIASGDLGFTLRLDDKTEFGELADHFTSMGAALKKGYSELEAQIQERKQAESALRLSEERLRLALDATSEVVWDWDVLGDFIYQPRWAPALGYPAEATPRTSEELVLHVHLEERRSFREQLAQLLKGSRETLELEHRVKTGSGEWKWMLTRARVVRREAGGQAGRVVGTSADVTERRRILDRLRLTDRLASVGTLAAGVAHEINNPLAYVISNVGYALELVRKREAAAAADGPAEELQEPLRKCREALEEADIGALRVRDIVRELRVFSRAEEDVRGPVDVNRALREALHFADPVIRHRARLVLRLGQVPPVTGNESRLSQVFVNLLVNAAQAIPEGRLGDNEIRVETRLADEGHIVVEVQDTGCGMTQEDRKRIFDPFFTTKPVGTGTGLGLAICHGIVTSLGGEIDVESQPGKGSLFRLRLPRAEPAEVSQPVEVKRVSRRGRILVVDDEPLFVRSVIRVLEDEHEVVALTDPREALRRIEGGERFDLLVSDLVMPDLSGMQFRQEVNRIAPRLAEDMLFVTGGALSGEAVDFVERWRDRVLQKPLAPAAFRAAVCDALERSAELHGTNPPALR